MTPISHNYPYPVTLRTGQLYSALHSLAQDIGHSALEQQLNTQSLAVIWGLERWLNKLKLLEILREKDSGAPKDKAMELVAAGVLLPLPGLPTHQILLGVQGELPQYIPGLHAEPGQVEEGHASRPILKIQAWLINTEFANRLNPEPIEELSFTGFTNLDSILPGHIGRSHQVEMCLKGLEIRACDVKNQESLRLLCESSLAPKSSDGTNEKAVAPLAEHLAEHLVKTPWLNLYQPHFRACLQTVDESTEVTAHHPKADLLVLPSLMQTLSNIFRRCLESDNDEQVLLFKSLSDALRFYEGDNDLLHSGPARQKPLSAFHQMVYQIKAILKNDRNTLESYESLIAFQNQEQHSKQDELAHAFVGSARRVCVVWDNTHQSGPFYQLVRLGVESNITILMRDVQSSSTGDTKFVSRRPYEPAGIFESTTAAMETVGEVKALAKGKDFWVESIPTTVAQHWMEFLESDGVQTLRCLSNAAYC